MTVLGIDVSRWQSSTPSLNGMGFLFARASYGTVKDSTYDMHIANARKAGLVVGAYHFAYSGNIAAQAAAFLKAAGEVEFYFIDVEASTAPSKDEVHTFLHAMHVAGKHCGLYHSASGFFDAGQDYNWVAKWGSVPPSGSWQFWQYQGSPLDRDQFNGSHDDLTHLAQYPTAPVTDTGDTAMKLTSVTDASGKATMDADGPVWHVADGTSATAPKGSTRTVIGACEFDSPGLAGTTTSPGYIISSNAADGELLVVAKSRVTFVPTPVAVEDGYTKATQDAAVATALSAQAAALTAAKAAAATAASTLAVSEQHLAHTYEKIDALKG